MLKPAALIIMHESTGVRYFITFAVNPNKRHQSLHTTEDAVKIHLSENTQDNKDLRHLIM